MELWMIILSLLGGAGAYFLQKKLKNTFPDGAPDLTKKILKPNEDDKNITRPSNEPKKKFIDPYEHVESTFLGACKRAKEKSPYPEKIDKIIISYEKKTAKLKEKLAPLQDQIKEIEKELSNIDISERKQDSLELKEEKLDEKISDIEDKIEEIEDDLSSTDIGILVVKPELSLGVPLSVIENYGKFFHELPKPVQTIYEKYLSHYLEDVEIIDFERVYHREKDSKLMELEKVLNELKNEDVSDSDKVECVWNYAKQKKSHRARKIFKNKDQVFEIIEMDKLASIMDLSNNVMDILEANGLASITSLRECNLKDLEKIKGIGPRTIASINLGLEIDLGQI